MNSFFLNITTNIVSSFLLASQLEQFPNKSHPPKKEQFQELYN